MKTKTFFRLTIVLSMLILIITPVLAMAPGMPAIETTPPAPSPLLQILGEVLGLSAFLFAFVAWLKQAGIVGTWLTISSLGGGWLIGGLIRYATIPPVTVAEWIWLFLYGFIAGLVASGAYKGVEFANKTDAASLTKAKSADSAQTAKVVAAIEGDAEKQYPA